MEGCKGLENGEKVRNNKKYIINQNLIRQDTDKGRVVQSRCVNKPIKNITKKRQSNKTR